MTLSEKEWKILQSHVLDQEADRILSIKVIDMKVKP